MALPQASELNEWATKIHAHNVAVGWWDNNPSVLEKIHLITTEICEATEGARKDLMDDHLPHRKMEEVELADALIRTLDVGAKLGISVFDAVRLSVTATAIVNDIFSTERTAEKHFFITKCIVYFGNVLFRKTGSVTAEYNILVASIFACSQSRGFDIMAAMAEKFEYNKHRADHKREARAQANGKKF